MEVLTKPKDKDSFMRAFMLLALGFVFCLGTDNATTPRYLYNLLDVSKIKSFDWARHILDELMNQVRKYQIYDPKVEGAAASPYVGSYLAVLAVCSFFLFVLYSFCSPIAITLLICFIGTTSCVAIAIYICFST